MRCVVRPILLLAALGASGLAGCASTVKGSWSCAIDRAGVCSSITDIDRSPPANARNGYALAAEGRGGVSGSDPVIADAIPARLWQDAAWQAGPIAGAPVHEPDQVVKVAIAPWVDGSGDYHAGAEVYSVMRKGGWYVAPRGAVRRVELAATPQAQPGPVTAAAHDPRPTLLVEPAKTVTPQKVAPGASMALAKPAPLEALVH